MRIVNVVPISISKPSRDPHTQQLAGIPLVALETLIVEAQGAGN